jgi:hypothetical protein
MGTLRNVVVVFRYPGYHCHEYSVVFMVEDEDDLREQVIHWQRDHRNVILTRVNLYS